MSRIRSVHPGLWTDERFVGLAPITRLLFIAIWNECDDQGSFEWSPLKLKMRLLPADNVEVVPLLDEMVSAGVVTRYEEGAKQFGAVRNFCQYQRPKKPNSIYPQTDEVRKWVNTDARSTRDGGEPSPPSEALTSPPVGNPFPTGGEKPRQRKEGGGREGGRPPSGEVAAAGGSRLPLDFALPREWRDWAAQDRKWHEDRVTAEAAKFIDFWHGKAGKDGRKADWLATWRNWCRRADEGRSGGSGGGSRRVPGDDSWGVGDVRMSSPC